MTPQASTPPTSGDLGPPQLETLLTYDQAGEVLGVTGRTVQDIVKRGDLPAVRFGGSVRIDPEDLRTFIRVRKGEAAPNDERGGRNATER